MTQNIVPYMAYCPHAGKSFSCLVFFRGTDVLYVIY